MSYFFRQRYHLSKEAAFNETDHPRGKTTPNSTPGSFAPAEGVGSSVGSTVRKFREENTPALDAAVERSMTPAQTMFAQWGPRPSEQEVKDALALRVGDKAWAEYVAGSAKADADMAAAGGDTQARYATITKDAKGNEIPVYDQERLDEVQDPVVEAYRDKYMQAALHFRGDAPELVVLAGRGGSGKSAFGPDRAGRGGNYFMGFYDDSYVVLDPDEIKKELFNSAKASGKYPQDAAFDPTSDGASYWHEESSYVTKRIQAAIVDAAAQGYKANVVYDLTLASNKIKDVKALTAHGFTATMANMNVPVQESAYNALNRYLRNGPEDRGRLVGVGVIANSRSNEKNFDDMLAEKNPDGTPVVSSWAILTARTGGPRLVAAGGKPRKKRGS